MMPMMPIMPSGYQPHIRRSPLTDPWEPLFVPTDCEGGAYCMRHP